MITSSNKREESKEKDSISIIIIIIHLDPGRHSLSWPMEYDRVQWFQKTCPQTATDRVLSLGQAPAFDLDRYEDEVAGADEVLVVTAVVSEHTDPEHSRHRPTLTVTR